MEKNISLSAPLKRITVLDALRGFALFGVIIMHMLQRFGNGFGGSVEEVLRFPAIDEIIQWIGNNIIMGRFINIFAFLFGLISVILSLKTLSRYSLLTFLRLIILPVVFSVIFTSNIISS